MVTLATSSPERRKKALQYLLAAIEALETGSEPHYPEFQRIPEYGICSNMRSYFRHHPDGNVFDYWVRARAYMEIFMRTWPLKSANPEYPIPAPPELGQCRPELFYTQEMDHWQGYGLGMRMKLLSHMKIECVKWLEE